MNLREIDFSIPEILSLIGLTQCVYILVYMIFRSGDFVRAFLPFLYFFILGCAFFLDFAQRLLTEIGPPYALLQWAAWFYGPPLSVLLIIQLCEVTRGPAWRNYWVLLLTPAAFAAAALLTQNEDGCARFSYCPEMRDWLVICGLGAGLASLAAIWGRRRYILALHRNKTGRERYWLVMTLIMVNLLFLALMLASLSPALRAADANLIRTLLGIGCVYLAGTSLFRIYPAAVHIVEKSRGGSGSQPMSGDEKAVAQRIESLLTLEKVYQEPSYGRPQLARELDMPESAVSRIISAHFGKSFPQILNEKRVEDAKRMLVETTASIKTIAAESGFNSTASFNRVFRDLTGRTPSDYRKKEGIRD
jgi:AraC-like DNA-binding protein